MAGLVAGLVPRPRNTTKAALRLATATLLTGLLALSGVALLLAALCVALAPAVGTAGALALTGLVCLGLACLGLAVAALAATARPPLPPPPPVPHPDPMLKMVFDLGTLLGRSLRRR